MKKLTATLGFGGILTPQDIRHFSAHFKAKQLKTGEHFQKDGEVAREIAFVENGILRLYGVTPEGDDVTKYFVRENQFIVDLESYYSARPSTEAIQAVVDSEIYIVHKSSIEKLSQEIPNLYIFIKTLSEAALMAKLKDNDFLNFGDAKTKYLEFVKRYPELSLRVPLQFIASYLRITPQSLSRIRREIR
ncbi:cAMP-binding domain of CRP or a regulatory subunit of cAMP-dependent protein kinases [Chitinophaga eiseniae]|uniref:cAMP-binding domain of CRP or a regulatory subunit of cAMP-dependent protein kinases n=1 Tax=Chitinophaga eiseniae TaxID=634771 RepID=A0A1T4P0A5_9BACT|nr:Crp/Fnr family transcriptional regulator [Chitinophaga eiseniae]SJZ84869.1 cAMP-binding domain of CRP or a regulatory subunit of cAMP-dependent protein kinases [Chitinophaga eiseniae]